MTGEGKGEGKGEGAMRIAAAEGGDYLRGLLVLSRKDRRIADAEAALVGRAARALGYCPRFCAEAIAGILGNRFIDDTPPRFPSAALARKFVRDAIVLASADEQVHPAEARWLGLVVERNGICRAWYRRQVERLAGALGSRTPLEVDGLAVEHF